MTSSAPDAIVNQFVAFLEGQCDGKTARHFLELCDWNLEHALSLYFSQHEDSPPPRQQPSIIQEEQRSSEITVESAGPPVPIQPSLSFFFSDIGRRIVSPFSSVVKACLSAWQTLINFMFASSMFYRPLDFNAYFEEQCGSPRPQFAADFGQACRAALRNRRVLVVYLHNPASRQPPPAFRDEGFLDLLGSTSVIWGTLHRHLESFMIRRLLRSSSSSSALAVFVPTGSSDRPLQGPSQTIEGFRLIGKLEGSELEGEGIGLLLQSALFEIAEAVTEERRKAARVAENQRIRMEQDRAYEEALLKDRAAAASRETATREAAMASERSALERRTSEIESQRRAQQFQEEQAAQRQSGDAFVLREIAALSAGTPRDLGLKVRVRTPGGCRLDREFAATSPMSHVFEWIDAVAASKQFANAEEYIRDVALDGFLSEGVASIATAIFGGCWTGPEQSLSLPTAYYLSASFPTRKFFRNAKQNVLLAELGSDIALFLHELDSAAMAATAPADESASDRGTESGEASP